MYCVLGISHVLDGCGVCCSQIDPDERPIFEEAVKILEQTAVVDEGEGEGEGEGAGGEEGLRPCFSEPLLRCVDNLMYMYIVHVCTT